MSKNKIFIYFLVLVICLLIAVPSTYKVVKKHNERMLKNTIETIVEAAKDCYYNDSCVDEVITLKELYEKTGLDTMYNPISKRIYNEDSYVNVSEDFKFVAIE